MTEVIKVNSIKEVPPDEPVVWLVNGSYHWNSISDTNCPYSDKDL